MLITTGAMLIAVIACLYCEMKKVFDKLSNNMNDNFDKTDKLFVAILKIVSNQNLKK